MLEFQVKLVADIFSACVSDYEKAQEKYGDSLDDCRFSSLIDLVYIKILRIKSLEEKSEVKVKDESILDTYRSIINYSIIGLLRLSELFEEEQTYVDYEETCVSIQACLSDKNHDYGDAWMKIEVSSMTDIMEIKILRIKTALQNLHASEISEETFFTIVSDALKDIVNYAIFSTMRLLTPLEQD